MKHLKLLLALALVLVAVFALAACETCDHEFAVSAEVDATCSKSGSVTYTCPKCEASYTKYTNPIDHVYTDKVVDASCSELGYTEHICACGYSYKDNYTEKKAHTYTSAVTAATCSASGYTTYTCVCGDSYKAEFTPVLEHTYTKKDTVAPTCLKSGYTNYACVCGDTYQADFVAPLGEHPYTSKVTAPTHTESGYTTYTCACGETYKDDYVPALGHTYTVTETEATCTTDGSIVSVCSCGDKKEEKISAYGHKVYELIETKELACNEDGYIKYKCSCGETITQILISTGHAFKPVKTVPGSCVDGYIEYACTCGVKQTETVPAVGYHVYETTLLALSENEKKLNPNAIGREQLSCIGCGVQGGLGDALYEFMTFEDSFDSHTYFAPESAANVEGGKLSLTQSLYVTDALHLVSGSNTVLKNYSISFDVVLNADPNSSNYNPQTNTGSAKPPIFFALIDGKNKWDYKNPALGLDRISTNEAGGFELRIYRHDWGSKPKDEGGLNAGTGFFMELHTAYSIKMDFAAVGSTYKVTLYAKEVSDADYQELGTYDLLGSYNNEKSYLYFEGVGNTYDNLKVSGEFGEYIDPETCNHVFEVTGMVALSAGEQKKNPNAIGRELLTCSVCTPLEGDTVPTMLGDAVYEYMTFDSSFGNHANLTPASTPSVSGGKWTLGSSLYITDSLHLVSAQNTLLKEYNISFDVIVNYSPENKDYHPKDGSGADKPPIFFSLIDDKNKWDAKNAALGLNRDEKNADGAYELLIYAHHDANRLPTEGDGYTHHTGYYVTLGAEYSISMDFVSDVVAGTYKVTLYIKEAGADQYTSCGTFDIKADKTNATSYIYFEGANNVYDNFKISGAFTEYIDPATCDHAAEYCVPGLAPIATEREQILNHFAIGREGSVCTRCGTVLEGTGTAVYEYMTFDSSFENHANTHVASTPSVSNGAFVTTNDEFFMDDYLDLVSGRNSKITEYTISFDVILNHVPSTTIDAEKYDAFFDIRSGSNKNENKSPALIINKDSTDANGGYELYIQDNSWSSKPKRSQTTGYFMQLGKQYSIKMDFVHSSSKRTVTLSIMAEGDTEYTKLVTQDLERYYGEGSYFVFRGEGNSYDNFKISAPAFNEVSKPNGCGDGNHTYTTKIFHLTVSEEEINTNAIDREMTYCTACGEVAEDNCIYVNLEFSGVKSASDLKKYTGSATYQALADDQKTASAAYFDDQVNMDTFNGHSISAKIEGGVLKINSTCWQKDNLNLVSKNGSALKSYTISFDFTLADANKDFIWNMGQFGNTGNNMPILLSIDSSSTKTVGESVAYEVVLTSKAWGSTGYSGGTAGSVNHTGYFIEVGKAYTFQLDFVDSTATKDFDGKTATFGYDCTISIKGLTTDAATSTYSLAQYTGSDTPSVICFSRWDSAGNTFDNYKVIAPYKTTK